MSATLEKLIRDYDHLPLAEQVNFCDLLEKRRQRQEHHDVDESPAAIEAAWDMEIAGRVSEIESGKVTLLSHHEFMSAFDEARSELRQTAHA